MWNALHIYADKLKDKQRRALTMICKGGMTDKAVADACDMWPSAVSPIRAWFDYYSRPFLALAESLLTADDAAVEAVNAPPAAVLHDETAAQIAEVLDGEGGLDFAATTLRAPEVDGNKGCAPPG
jgi:hypothetical protein